MAIEWGSWEGSSPNRIRVGIDVDWEAVTHGEAAATVTVKYYVDVEGNWSDTQTLNFTGDLGGSITFSNNQNNSQALRETKTKTYNYGNCEYGSSPGNYTFGVNLTGAFNGATPSKSRTTSIPKRPYGAPAAPTNVSSSRISDSSIKTTWTNKETCGEPWDSLDVQRDDAANGVWNAIVGTPGGGSTSFTDSTTVSNYAYRYRVRAKNSVDTTAYVESDLIYTTPATPTNLVRTGNNAAPQVLTWNNPVSTYMDHRIEIQRAENGGAFATIVEFHARDSETYTDNDPYVIANPAKKFKYRVRSRTWGGAQGVLYSAYSNESSETTGVTTPPNAPTNLSPSNGTVLNPKQQRIFTWQHNTTDQTAQTAYELQWRANGGAWTSTGKVVSTLAQRTIAANTFPDNSNIDWQVRTWGQASAGGSDGTGASAWSAIAAVVTVGDPNARRESKRVMRLNLETGRQETAPVGVLPPIGSVTLFAAAAAPTGWLMCWGQLVDITTYEDLFGVIGHAYNGGVDPGGNLFRLPDMRLRIPIGAHDGTISHIMSLGANDGRAYSTLRGDSHSHAHSHGHTIATNTTGSSHVHNISGQAAGATVTGGTASGSAPTNGAYTGHAHGGGTNNNSPDSSHTHGITGSVSSATGLAETTTTAHSWTTFHYIIKT